MHRLPVFLIVFRAAAGAAVVLLSLAPWGGRWAAAVIGAALLSDILDGAIARRLGLATEPLRVADSYVDAAFYACVAWAAWLRAPDAIAACRWPLLMLGCLQLLSYGIDISRYGRIASFHAYTAKLWGLTLASAGMALVGWRTGGPFLWAMIAAGFLANIDGLAIKLLLPEWRHDVSSAFEAARRRRR